MLLRYRYGRPFINTCIIDVLIYQITYYLSFGRISYPFAEAISLSVGSSAAMGVRPTSGSYSPSKGRSAWYQPEIMMDVATMENVRVKTIQCLGARTLTVKPTIQMHHICGISLINNAESRLKRAGGLPLRGGEDNSKSVRLCCCFMNVSETVVWDVMGQ